MRRYLFFLLVLFCFAGTSVALAEDMVVIATGVGRTDAAALQDARQNALRITSNGLLSTSVLRKQWNTLQEKIFSKEQDYIASATPLGDPRIVDGGLVQCSIEAHIKKADLLATLKREGLTVQSIDGFSAVASHQTRTETHQDAGQIMTEVLRPLPTGLLAATADVSKAKHRFDGSTMRIEVPVTVKVDTAAYSRTVSDIRGKLEQLGIRTYTANLSGAAEQSLDGFWKATGLPVPAGKDDTRALVALCELLGEKDSRWGIAAVPPPVAAAFDRSSTVRVKVELLDVTQSVVTFREMTLGTLKNKTAGNLFAYSKQTQTACLVPSVNSVDVAGGKCSFGKGAQQVYQDTAVFNLSLDELRTITSVRCVVSNL